jgi:hypothetical protein
VGEANKGVKCGDKRVVFQVLDTVLAIHTGKETGMVKNDQRPAEGICDPSRRKTTCKDRKMPTPKTLQCMHTPRQAPRPQKRKQALTSAAKETWSGGLLRSRDKTSPPSYCHVLPCPQ